MAKTDKKNDQLTQVNSMNAQFPYTLDIKFPGDLEYIPAIRKFIAELLQVSDFTPRFAYRSEIIVDEICNNAVVFGCHTENAEIHLVSTINRDHIEFTIKDQGGSKDHLARLKKAIRSEPHEKNDSLHEKGLGLEIVRMLSERMDVVIDENNLTSVHVLRKRENEQHNS